MTNISRPKGSKNKPKIIQTTEKVTIETKEEVKELPSKEEALESIRQDTPDKPIIKES